MRKGIDNLIINGFGWITSHGEFYAVQQWKHLEEIISILEDSNFDHEVLKGFISKTNSELKTIEQECQELADECGGICHGEWHNYEMAQTSLAKKIVYKAYECGWIRVGKNGIMGIEGTPKGIKARYHDIQKLQDEIGLDNPIDYYKINP